MIYQNRKFHDNTKSTDKEFKIWDGLYHEILNEANGSEIVDYFINWTNSHI